MTILIEPVYRLAWNEAQGAYVETGELLGYKAVNWLGQMLAFGESRDAAYDNALEAMADALGD